MKCNWHLCNNETQNNKTFCSKRCNQRFSHQKRRMNLKLQAINYKGGKCEICGYDKCNDAFDFHHTDPSKKDFSISRDGIKFKFERLKPELDKCMLLCANCHREIHATNKKTHYIFEDILNPVITVHKLPKPKIKKERNYKITWPSDDELAQLVWQKPRSTLAKELGVSDKAIGKRCQSKNISQPSRGYWTKKK